MKKIIFLLFLFPLCVLGQDQFCEDLSAENFTALSNQINTFFINNNLDPLGENKIDIKFNEIDALIDYLSEFNCVDSTYYRLGRGTVMESLPPMADLTLSSNIQGIKNNYLIRLRFENYTKVVFIK